MSVCVRERERANSFVSHSHVKLFYVNVNLSVLKYSHMWKAYHKEKASDGFLNVSKKLCSLDVTL